jgi:autotransporter-associated beta strand protein
VLAGTTVFVDDNLGLNTNSLSAAVLGALGGSGNINLVGTSLTVGGDNESPVDYTGNLSANTTSPPSITKVGTGTWQLRGSGTNYFGDVEIDQRAVEIDATDALVNSTVSPMTTTFDGVTFTGTLTTDSGLATAVIGGLAGDGAVEVANANYTVGGNDANTTFSGTLSSYTTNTFTKEGTGTLTMTGESGYGGDTTVMHGTLALGVDGGNALLTGTLTVDAAGTLKFTADGGGISHPAPMPSSVVLDGGAMVVNASIAVALGNTFESSGSLTLVPGTSSLPTVLRNTSGTQMQFDEGSRTYISDARDLPDIDAYLDLGGQDALVSGTPGTVSNPGALFVNNGYVYDSFEVGAALDAFGTNQTDPNNIVDGGAVVKGAGFFDNSVRTSYTIGSTTYYGGLFQAGNSPGSDTVGQLVLGPGGVSGYLFTVNDATGTAGPHPDANGQVSGWGLVNVEGNVAWNADAAHKLVVNLQTLANPTTVGNDVAGPMDHFDPSQPYVWEAIHWTGTYTGPSDAATLNASTTFDASGMVNAFGGKFSWQIDTTAKTLSLVYTPPPAVAAVDLSNSSITVTFSTAVNFAGGDVAPAFRLINTDSGAAADLTAAVTVDGSGRTVVTLTFDGGALAAGHYQLDILSNALTGNDGTALDGSGLGAGNGVDYLGPIWTVG